MTGRGFLLKAAAVVAAAVIGGAGVLEARQKPAGTLGEVKIAKPVMANGQRLAAGTYTIRLTGDQGKPVVGQTPDESQWVEFVQGKETKGRELATALSSAEAKKIAKSVKMPASGATATELLKGGDYLRVVVTKGGTYYLVHLAVAAS